MADKPDILLEFRKRLGRSMDSTAARDRAVDDLNFVYNVDGDSQWPDETLAKRANRPNYTFNRVIGPVNQVIGDQRQNKPTIKVRGVDSEADPDTAEVYNGLIRNIENISDAETAYDTAFKMAASCGYGVWRVEPVFNDDDSFDQDIIIKRIANPFTVYFDPSAQDFCKRDGNYVIITERISKDEFRALYPKATTNDIDFDDKDGRYMTSDEIRIAEYYRKVPVDKTLALLSDGRSVIYDRDMKAVEDELAQMQITVVRKRQVRSYKIEWAKMSGAEILDGPTVYDWKFIPVVPVFGRVINIEGEDNFEGIARHSKDAQRSYNYTRSTAMETIAMQPKSPYMATAAMIKDHEAMWRQANAKNFPYLLYDVDPAAPMAKPSREAPPTVPIALINQAQQDQDDIRAATGFFAPALGEPSNEVSGVAINARKQEGDVGSFEFVDNLGKAIRFTGEILVDMIPRVYDNERVVRIIGLDGAEDYVTINQEVEDQQTGEMKRVNDLGTGKYDVAVTLGPSFTTQRQEALAGLVEVSGAVPIVAEVAADQVVKNLDVPGADEIEKRVKIAMIQRGIIQPGKDDEEIVAELQQSVGQQNQAINAELEQEKLQEQAKTEREIVAAEGDIQKEVIRAEADAAKRDEERAFEREKMALEREKMALESDKIDLERDRLKASAATDIQNERVSKETQKTNGANMETFAKSLTEAITGLSGAAEKMADASEAQADAAKVAAMPKRLVRDPESGQAIGAEPVSKLN